MNTTLSLFVLLFCVQAYAEPREDTPVDTVEWKEQSPFSFSGKSEIKVSNPVVGVNHIIDLDVRFFNGSDDHAPFSNPVFFNVFLQNREGPIPVALALFDEKHKFVKNLPVSAEGPRIRVTKDDWSSVPFEVYVGTHLRAMIELRPLSSLPTFPVGTYYLQLLYNESFIAPRPRNEEELANFLAYKKWSELFRSNTVKIKVTSGRIF